MSDNYFSNEEKVAIAHLLFQMMLTDGKIDKEEISFFEFLRQDYLYLTESDMYYARDKMETIQAFKIIEAMNTPKKIEAFSLLQNMMEVDGEVTDAELALLSFVAVTCKFTR